MSGPASPASGPASDGGRKLAVPLIDSRDPAVAGGKGASLGELTRAGVAVPAGFVVTADAFAAAMAAIDPLGALRAELSALDAADLAAIAAAAARLRALVAGAPLPDDVYAAIAVGYAKLGTGGSARENLINTDVAVRSSATVEDSAEASFAGLQDTYLGVSGIPSVHDHVRRCWASLYNDESVAYRRRLRLPEAGVSMAVVVQRMVAPRAAGVMFTRSPVTGDRSVVAIEATWGLGSALVSGDVTPDSFIISKVTGEITTRRVAGKIKIHSYRSNGPGVTVEDTPASLREAPSLTDDEIRALAAIGRRVEAHYGAPQDIEWALLDGDGADADGTADAADAASAADRIVLLQSRPETVWAAREQAPAGAPKPRPADHVLALFGKQL
jgi:phosphoenolpyruvate synthase/pyruvate phosphate dikinase